MTNLQAGVSMVDSIVQCVWMNLMHSTFSMVGDDKLSPNLLRGRGKSIGGDLDIDDEGSE
jgi:hypothetical protein